MTYTPRGGSAIEGNSASQTPSSVAAIARDAPTSDLEAA